MPRVTRKSVASKEEPSSTENQGSTSKRKRGSKKEEPVSGDVTTEKPQAESSKRGGRQAAKEVHKPDTSVKKKAASRGKSRGGREKKPKESESEDSAVDSESENEEESVPKGGRGRGKSSSTARNINKVEQSSKSTVTGNVRGRGKSGQSSREVKKKEGNDEEEEQDEETDEGTAVRSRSVGRRGGARQSSKATKKEEEQDETEEVRPQGRAGKSRKAAKNENKNVNTEENVEEESEEETPVKGRGQRAKSKPVKIEENIEEDEGDNSRNSSKRRGRAAVTSSQGGRHSTAKAASVEESEEMEVDEAEIDDSKGESVDATKAGSAASSSTGGKKSRGQKIESTEKSSLGKTSARADVVSTSAASRKQKKKSVAENMEIEEEVASSKTETVRAEPDDSEKRSSESSFTSKHKLEDDKQQTTKRLRLSEDKSESAKSEDCNVGSNDDVAESDSKEVADFQPLAATETSSQPTTPEDTAYEGPRINPFLAVPGVPFVVPLTEAELTKQYTTQLTDKDETSSIMVEVGSECASDITGLSSRGIDVSDFISLDSMDLVQGETAADPSTGPSSPSNSLSASSQGVTFQEPHSVSTGDKLVMLQNSTPDAASEDSQPAATASQLPTSAAVVESPSVAPSNQFAGILEVHAESEPVENTSSEDLSDTSSAPNQNGTVEVSPGPETLVPEIYIPSSTAIDSRKFILNPAFPVEGMDPAFCFSVVSYNILADCHMRRSDYSYTQPQFLDQEYRHRLLLKELDYLDGDIICLQEVSPTYYTQLLQPDMKSRGYDGHFMKRTKDYWNEGEATFVKTSKFDVTSHQCISLADLAFREVDDSGLDEEVNKAAKKYLDRADVILLTELTCKKTGKVVNVCNIHVVYDLIALDVQCIQVACAIKQLVAKAGSDLNPHIICGDFNSEVTCPAYQLAKDGYLSNDHIQELQSLKNLDVADGSSHSLIHHLWRAFQHTSSNLKSAYEVTLGKEPPITSFTKVTHATLDYIFYSAASVDVVGVLETLDLPVVNATGGLPSDSIPSDHLALKTVFRLK